MMLRCWVGGWGLVSTLVFVSLPVAPLMGVKDWRGRGVRVPRSLEKAACAREAVSRSSC